MLSIVSFLLALLVLVLVHEYGHFKAARLLGVTVEEFGVGFPPAAWQKQIGETIYSVNWLPLGGFVRIKGEDGESRDFDSFGMQPVGRRALIVAAGILMNVLLAVVLFTVGFSLGMPQELNERLASNARVRDVSHSILGTLPGSPADTVLASGDELLRLDGQSFVDRASVQQYLQSRVGQSVQVEYEREGAVRTVSIQPTSLALEDGESRVGIGVQLFTVGTVSYPVYWAPVEAVRLSFETIGLIVTTFWEMLRQLAGGSTSGVEITGPVGIALLSGEVAARGAIYFLQFVAILSLNLAIVNALPIPALDGGRLLFLGIEAIRRRPVTAAIEGRIHRLGFALLITLVLVVTYSDIRRLTDVFTPWWR